LVSSVYSGQFSPEKYYFSLSIERIKEKNIVKNATRKTPLVAGTPYMMNDRK
jgi:hypothetical protein